MSPETAARLAAAESASLRPDARMVTTMSLAFEGFFEEMGCPFTPEQRAAIEQARSELAA